MVRYLILMLLMILVSIILIVLHRKYLRRTAPAILPDSTNTPVNKKWMIAVCCLSAIIYTGLAFLLSMSWLQGDDFLFPPLSEHFPINAKIGYACHRYSQLVSRFGEIVIVLLGVSENRWQQFLITPACIVAIPYTLHRLLSLSKESIFNSKGFFYIILCTSLMLFCGIFGGGEWRNFRCAAAGANYLWPLAFLGYFLSFYRLDYQKRNSTVMAIVLFILGVYCGWSIECITILLVPGLIIWAIYLYLKKISITNQCFAGILGAMWGFFMLFASPALSKRALRAKESIGIDPSSFSFEEAFNFVTNLNPEKMQALEGGCIRAAIGDFPLPLRAFFLPELMKYYLPYCAATLVISSILIFLTIFTKKRRYILSTTLWGLTISFLSICSYLAGGIPFDMSFLPPAFILIATTCYIYLNSTIHSYIKIVLSLSLSITLLTYLIPAGTEAWQYVPARDAHMKRIHDKIEAGEMNLILPAPYKKAPIDKLGLLNKGAPAPYNTEYPNGAASAYFNVKSIIQEKPEPAER